MLTKTKKIALLTTGLAGTLLATTIGGVVLSSCTTGSVTEDPKNQFGNKFTTSIDWNNQVEVSRLNIDKNGLVYSDQDRTILIGVLPSTSVSELVIPRSVKQISGYINKTSDKNNNTPTGAFENQTTLTSIRFEGSEVQIIGPQAFKGCTSLTTIQLPSSVTTIGNNAFEDTGAIAQINLDNIKFIGNSSFKNAFSKLPPNTVELNLSNAQFIDTMAFMKNTAIKTINFNNNKSLREIKESAFESSVIPGSINLSNANYLKTIGPKAFKNTTELTSITLPNSLTTLGSNATDSGVFQNSSISSIDLSNTAISTLNQSTFNSATNLTSVLLPDTLNTIDVSAFSNTAISTLDLSKTKISTLKNDSFMGLTNITEIKFPQSLSTLGNNVFRQSSIETVDFTNTKLTVISQGSFLGATKLKSIILPTNLTTIGQEAFKQTTSLETIDLSKNTKLNSIGNNAFEESAITSITLPKLTTLSTTTTIGTSAFKGSKIKTADLSSANLTTIANSTFENCSNLEKVLIKSPDLDQVNNPNATALQKQITTIGQAAFKNAKKLKAIFHVVDDNTNDQLTPNGVVVASPFLTSIGSEAFYNVPEIRVFDASKVVNPSNNGNLVGDRLFNKDLNLVDEANNPLESKLEAVILPPKLDDDPNNNYYVGHGAFKNNPKLTHVGTKKTLGFDEGNTPLLKADDYISKFKVAGFQAPKKLNAIGENSFENTGIEVVNFKETEIANGNTLGSSTTGPSSYGYMTFSHTKNLKKVILPTKLTVIQEKMFWDTPSLQEVNFNELTSLTTLGTDNFTNLYNFKSSSITADATPQNYHLNLARSTKEETPTPPTPILDLTDLKITSISARSFTGLPNNVQVKLSNVITGLGGNDTLTQLTKPFDGNTSENLTTVKVPAQNLRFEEVSGLDKTLEKIQSMAVTSSGVTQNLYFYTDPNMDLTKFSTLTTLSPATFNDNPNLETIKLSPKVTTWQINQTSGNGPTLASKYRQAAINNANKLKEISFNGFGGTYSSSTFTGDNSDITNLSSANWDNMIKNNSVLWTNISTMMNSLGYDASLEANGTEVNNTPVATVSPGVLDKWRAATKDASDNITIGSRPWIDVDLNTDGSDLKGANKWYTTKPTNDAATANENISDNAPTANKKAYFKHNGIIWEWSATVGTDSKISISLTPDQSTLPNVYKAIKVDSSSEGYITTFRSAKVNLTASAKKASTLSYGVNIKFNIAVQPASKTK